MDGRTEIRSYPIGWEMGGKIQYSIQPGHVCIGNSLLERIEKLGKFLSEFFLGRPVLHKMSE
jgi:hypothetical protein